MVCANCDRTKKGKSLYDKHHVAGKKNSPVTIAIPVNDHRAYLSPMQIDWPNLTLQNKRGSLLLAAAASVRGFVDTVCYLMEKLLLPIAEMLESLDRFLVQRLGADWQNDFTRYVDEHRLHNKP